MNDDKFMRIVAKIPSTWHCVRCAEEFDNGPFSKEMPHAFEVITNPRTGLRKRGGDICKRCYMLTRDDKAV